LKNEGRKKRNQEIKDEQKSKQQKIESLKKITKESSAQLASYNHYTLDETIRDMVFEQKQLQKQRRWQQNNGNEQQNRKNRVSK
jgi:hypothetical protein